MFIYDENTKEERLIVKYKVYYYEETDSWIVDLYCYDADGEYELVYQDECAPYEEVEKLLEKIKRRNNGLSTN
tara:strand:- start:80 stop:298 length:219 start_codon:yes stop_codon:yes gene_type:complete